MEAFHFSLGGIATTVRWDYRLQIVAKSGFRNNKNYFSETMLSMQIQWKLLISENFHFATSEIIFGEDLSSDAILLHTSGSISRENYFAI